MDEKSSHRKIGLGTPAHLAGSRGRWSVCPLPPVAPSAVASWLPHIALVAPLTAEIQHVMFSEICDTPCAKRGSKPRGGLVALTPGLGEDCELPAEKRTNEAPRRSVKGAADVHLQSAPAKVDVCPLSCSCDQAPKDFFPARGKAHERKSGAACIVRI